ncbi:helix-turn-helix domain-containing protein [Antarctobacter sp.]|uniref:TetR/AcrR family transcriptional regulator n=1 Tax=Antarctobacter sp. TaxID=1872577 RepID=UPI002B272477|nr:helix-turn-helix domain-containing protein [Antarctobacter sp.]
MMDASDIERVKQEAILGAAMAVMCQYGFRRTSMEDIARAVGMSRPALYQHFRNKEDIARRMVEVYFDRAADEVAVALAGAGPVEAQLARAFAAKTGPMIREMLESPHGAELLDLKDSHARDVVEAGMARMTTVFADWLTHEAAQGRVALDGTAEQMAALLLRALDGIKRPPYARFATDRDRLAQVLGRGLRP